MGGFQLPKLQPVTVGRRARDGSADRRSAALHVERECRHVGVVSGDRMEPAVGAIAMTLAAASAIVARGRR